MSVPQEPIDAESWRAGDEYDDALIDRIHAALKRLGYATVERLSAVAGANDYACAKFEGPRSGLTVESETYMGITVTGPAELVSELKSLMA